ncbi:MAG: hypothetical protein AAF845_08335 [Bacteroidota bacterium]
MTLVTALGAAFWRRSEPPRTPPPPLDDLSSLGLSEVRVASPASDGDPEAEPDTSPEPAPEAGAPEAETTPDPEPAAAEAVPSSEAMTARPVTAPRSRPRPSRSRMNAPYVAPDSDLWDGDGLAAGLLLASLAEHLTGPAAVLHHDPEAGVYTVDAFGGDGDVPEAVEAEGTLLHSTPQDLVVTHLDADHLGGLEAFGAGACVRALDAPPSRRALLVVGVGEHAPDEATTALIGRYADLLAEITDLDEPEPAEPAAPVPRAVLIEEEQAACAEAGDPLAFALVTLADAEALLTQDTPETVAAAEAALRDRLGEAPSVRRVEPFGDLLFGVFLDLDREGAAAWCRDLAQADPPLFIGAVAPADGDPQAVREAATEALRDAYDQQRAQVVGVE